MGNGTFRNFNLISQDFGGFIPVFHAPAQARRLRFRARTMYCPLVVKTMIYADDDQ